MKGFLENFTQTRPKLLNPKGTHSALSSLGLVHINQDYQKLWTEKMRAWTKLRT